MEIKPDNYFVLQKLYSVSHIPTYVYNAAMQLIMVIPESDEDMNPFINDLESVKLIREYTVPKTAPIIFMEDVSIFYGAFLGTEDECYIFGPISSEPLSPLQIIPYKKRHKITHSNYHIQVNKLVAVVNLISLAYYSFTNRKVEEHEISFHWEGENKKTTVSRAEIEQYELEKFENNIKYTSYEYELMYMNAVITGDVDAMKKLLIDSDSINGVGKLADSDLKRMEYMCVASITLVVRAAIQGNLNPREANELGDLYLQKIAKCKTKEELAFVGAAMQLDFTNKVKENQSKQKNSVYIEQCKDFVAKHLHASFKISDIAETIGINISYLSRKFSEQEGMTIQQYINRERCNRAANMMKYSHYSIAEIAEYLCYSSQSHFGKQFKLNLGVTPYLYRKRNRYIESYDESQRPL